MSILHSLFPAIALVAFCITSWRYAQSRKAQGRPLPPSAWGWSIPSALALLFLMVWGMLGLLDGSLMPAYSFACSALIAASGALALRREDVWAWYDAKREGARRGLRICLVVGIAILSLYIIELPFNDWFPFGGPSYFWLEIILASLLLAGLYFLGQRHACLCGLGIALFFITGIGQYFIKRFKNAAILPADLMALNTAAAVSKEYVFSLNERAVAGIMCAMLCTCALSLVRPPSSSAEEDSTKKGFATNLAASAVSFALLAGIILVPNYMELFGVQMNYWYSIDYYQGQGFFPTFIAVLQDMPIRKPAGYTDQEAQALMEKYASEYRKNSKTQSHEAAVAQFEQEKPTVIAIMNESFSDLSIYDGIHADYAGPQFFKHGFGDALAQGTLNVTVHGSGTCNTEFEFLTGNALGFIGQGKYPYSIYDLSSVDALAANFKSWGYDTSAIHPNYATNWNRDKIYSQMGFDQFLAIEEFGGKPDCAVDKVTPEEPHCEVFHSGVSDRETYNRILQMLQENDHPQFIFDVTMANHGSYSQNNIPSEYQTHYLPQDSPNEEATGRLNEYLSCIEKSDDDLEEFVGKLRELNRPVVLVFFGDHQPNVSAEFNDYWYKNEPEDVHARRAFSTNYVIWANYDVAGCEQIGTVDETSTDMLAATTLDLIGAPVSDYQAAQLNIRTLIPSFSASGYQGNDRKWYAPDADSSFAKAYHDMSLIEYLNFATKV